MPTFIKIENKNNFPHAREAYNPMMFFMSMNLGDDQFEDKY